MEDIISDNSISCGYSIDEGLGVVFLNAERGKKYNEITAYLKYHPLLKNASIIILNEIDIGMARSGNKNIAYELGNRLCMNWAFGLEFREFSKGEEGERNISEENREALHGNAILSKFSLNDLSILRLPEKYDWSEDYQKRDGSRIALFSTIEIKKRKILLVSVHLEDRTDGKGRSEQMSKILEHIKSNYSELPVIMGGDMNTLTFSGNNEKVVPDLLIKDNDKGASRRMNPEKWEDLFALMEKNGYEYKSCNEKGKVTCRDNITGLDFVLELNLDWFFLKNIEASSCHTITSIFNCSELQGFFGITCVDGTEITDHNFLAIRIKVI